MAIKKRHKTKYLGVFYIDTTSPATGDPDKTYYIRYKRDGKTVEEKAGSASLHAMTPAKANNLRAARMKGIEPSNTERRRKAREARNKPTIDFLWDTYVTARPDLKGIVTDRNRYENHIQEPFGEKTVDKITQLDVDRLRLSLSKTKSPQTVKHVLALLKRIINHGAQKGLCSPLPFKITMPKVSNEKTEFLTDEQITGLMKALDEDTNVMHSNIVRLILLTGMRRGEVFSLKWEDIDLQRGFLRLHETKGGKPQTIPLSSKARALLESIPRTKSPYVFPNTKGGRKTVMNHRFIRRIKKKAGIPPEVRPLHSLRHTFASLLASSGKADLLVIQRLLTHRDPRMTNRYSHLRDQALRDASDLIGDLMSG